MSEVGRIGYACDGRALQTVADARQAGGRVTGSVTTPAQVGLITCATVPHCWLALERC
jgi:hypothetical protein